MIGIRGPKDFAAGLAYVAFGAAVIWKGRDYPFGTAVEMGPSYFPSLVAGILFAVGLASLGRSFLRPGDPIVNVAWRPLVVITGVIVLFGLLLRGAGLVPALTMLIIGSALAIPKPHWPSFFGLTVALLAFCYLVFVVGLGIPLEAFGSWFE